MTTTLAEPINSLTWRRHGNCNPWNADIFDGFTEGDRNYAKSLCRRCPVYDLCDQWRKAQDRSDLLGVVAGIYYGK